MHMCFLMAPFTRIMFGTSTSCMFGLTLCLQILIRESRYPIFLRRKNATDGTDGKAEMTSIRKSRGSLVDTRTEQSQVAIEGAIIKRA